MKNKEIAEALNISPAAVSMALNNKGGVSDVTMKKILDLKFSSQANEERIIKKGKLAFFVHIRNGNVISETYFFVMLMNEIKERAEKYGYYLNIIYYEQKDDYSDFILKNDISDVSGILVLATEMRNEDTDFYKKTGKPIVFIDNWFPGTKNDCVLMDNMDGVSQAVRYGFQMGHRKIGFVKSRVEINNFKERYEGFCLGMQDVGLKVEERYIYATKCTTDGAYEDMQTIIKDERMLPSLLIVSNDIMAIGIMNALKGANYNIPRDISIIGFDDMPVTKHFTPPITTVGINVEIIGDIAVDRLIEKIRNNNRKYFMHNAIGVDLVIRESVSAIMN